MKLAFLGTSEFAVPALKALVEAGHDVVAVYTRAPKPAGRGQQERRTPVHELALSLGLAVRTPKGLRSEEEAALPGLVLQAAPGPADTIRCGFTATKKLGGAVVRKRAKKA